MANQSPDNPDRNLREQLRVGVRMLEALELQLNRAEEVIQREEDARLRIEKNLTQLEALEDRATDVLTRLEGIMKEIDTPVAAPPVEIGIPVPSSGSLQASPRADIAHENISARPTAISPALSMQLKEAQAAREEFTQLIERAEIAQRRLEETPVRSGSSELANTLRRLAEELVDASQHPSTTESARPKGITVENTVEIDARSTSPTEV